MNNEEALLRALNGEEISMENFQPQTNTQAYLARLLGREGDLPYPRTNEEALLYALATGGGVPGGGGGDDSVSAEDALVARTLTEYSNDSVESVGKYVFYNHPSLTAVDFPVVTSVGDYAFQQCSSLTTANFPAATSVGTYAFQNCSKLTTANFPVATSVGTYAFHGCSKLTTVNFPVATSIDNYAFRDCTSLTTVDLSAAASVGIYAFTGCSSLTTLILRSKTIAKLSNTSALNNTPIVNGTGYIYIPRGLVDTYESNSTWRTYSAQFRALEDYTVDGTITGALDETKI